MTSCIQHGPTWLRRAHGIGVLGICAAIVVAMLAPVTSVATSVSPVAAPTRRTSTNTEYAQGTMAAAIGWAGNDQAVVACLSGSFVVKNNDQLYGYGVYDGSRTDR